jgi:hypothetical protein
MNRLPSLDIRGGALIELALISPLLILLCFGALQIAIATSQLQMATQLGKELATLAYRDCVAEHGVVGSPKFDPAACLSRTIQKFGTSTADLTTNGSFVVSLYNEDSGTYSRTASESFGGATTRFPADFSTSGPDVQTLKQALDDYHQLIVAEAFLPSLIQRLFPGWQAFSAGAIIYSSTVI